jgi:hypothetical protein
MLMNMLIKCGLKLVRKCAIKTESGRFISNINGNQPETQAKAGHVSSVFLNMCVVRV